MTETLRFEKGDEVPEWIAQGGSVRFGCDVVVERGGVTRISPQAELSNGEALVKIPAGGGVVDLSHRRVDFNTEPYPPKPVGVRVLGDPGRFYGR